MTFLLDSLYFGFSYLVNGKKSCFVEYHPGLVKDSISARTGRLSNSAGTELVC